MTTRDTYKAGRSRFQSDVILLFMTLLLGFKVETRTGAWPLASADALSNESCGRFLPRVAETDEDVPRVHRKKELVALSCTRYQSVQRPVRNTLICYLQGICSTMARVSDFGHLPTAESPAPGYANITFAPMGSILAAGLMPNFAEALLSSDKNGSSWLVSLR